MSSTVQARIAALTALAYVLLVLGDSLIRIAFTGDFFSFRMSFSQPLTWLICVFALVIVWGIWQRYAWAWWLGLAGGGYQLFRLLRWLFANHNLSYLPGPGVLLPLCLLLFFLLMLLLPGTRAACSR